MEFKPSPFRVEFAMERAAVGQVHRGVLLPHYLSTRASYLLICDRRYVILAVGGTVK